MSADRYKFLKGRKREEGGREGVRRIKRGRGKLGPNWLEVPPFDPIPIVALAVRRAKKGEKGKGETEKVADNVPAAGPG